ncbi:MAG: diguanylate cyclase [Spirochaetales bacterium]|nr:MAG: diguanylate cyclase [Spirochaetales bacterium]
MVDIDTAFTDELSVVHRMDELWHVVRTDPGGALDIARAAFKEGRSRGWKRAMASALVVAGGAESFMMRTADALRDLLEAVALAEDAGAHRETANARLRLAALYAQVGDYAAAFEDLERCFSEAKLAGDESLEAAALNNTGEIFRKQGRYEDAITYYDHALETIGNAGYPGSAGIYIGNRGMAHHSAGRLDQALKDYDEAAAIHEAYGNFPGLIELACRRAELATLRCDDFSAETIYRDALASALSRGLTGSECDVLLDYGSWLVDRGRLEEAESRLRRGMDLACSRGSRRHVMVALRILSGLAAAQGDHRSAYVRLLMSRRLERRSFDEDVGRRLTVLKVRTDLSWAEREVMQARDESARLKRRTQTIERSYELSRLVSRLGRAITAELDLTSACSELYEGVKRFVDAPSFAIAVFDPVAGKLRHVLVIDDRGDCNLSEDYLGNPQSLYVRCFRERCEFVTNDAQKNPVPDSVAGAGLEPTNRSFAFLPVMFGAEALGVVSVQSPRPDAYDESTLGAMRALSAFIAVTIKNARRFEDENARREAEIFRLKNVELKAKSDELNVALAEVREYARHEKEYKEMILAWNKRLEEQVKRRTRDLETMAISDGLTGLLNRRHVFELLDREIKASTRYGRSLSVLMVDVDDFKRVNDERGHRSGDAVLAEIARALRTQLRTTDLAGRYSGEEFLMILPETPLDGALILAERVREAVKVSSALEAMGLSMTISCGVATLDGQLDSMSLVEIADRRLFAAKEAGKDRVVAAD